VVSLCLAPIRGVTDAAYRSCAARLFGGFNDAVAPFVKTVEGQLKPGALSDLIPEKNAALPVIPQLLANNPIAFVEAAKQLEQIGAKEVNWNLGCPMPTSTRKKLGAGLLPHTAEIDQFLEVVFSSLSLKVSIKTRLGEVDPADIDPLIPVFNRYPLHEVIVHPRIAAQRYEGPLNFDAFARIAESLVHPLVYNGDIRTVDDFARLQSRFPRVNRWMIGRGALFNPFLPGEIKGHRPVSLQDRRGRLRTLHDEVYAAATAELSGFSHVHARMMQLWPFLSVAMGANERAEKKLRKSWNASAYEWLVRDLFCA